MSVYPLNVVHLLETGTVEALVRAVGTVVALGDPHTDELGDPSSPSTPSLFGRMASGPDVSGEPAAPGAPAPEVSTLATPQRTHAAVASTTDQRFCDAALVAT